MRRILPLLMASALLLTGCGDGNDDLREFVKNSGKDMKGKVEPLPEVTPYTPYPYEAFDIPDPFKPRKLKPEAGGGGLQPDFNRPRELLENFALENLKLVGVLQQKKTFFGVVKTPDNNLYRVKVGNYIGQNYGKIVAISDTEVRLKETVEDAAGMWTERENSLVLQEEK